MKNERYSTCDTIIVLEHRKDEAEKTQALAKKLKVKVWRADCVEDIIAIPAFLCIVNPDDINIGNWRWLVKAVKELDDPDMKIYLTGKTRKPTLPARNLVAAPGAPSDDFLKFLLLKTRAKIERKKRISDKSIRRITRLMFILRELDGGRPARISKIAEELEVNSRTIQRDIEILESAGYPLLQDKRGEFYLPKSFRAYELCYNE